MIAKIKIKTLIPFIATIILIIFSNCSETMNQAPSPHAYKILFLHHSTGKIIWEGNQKGINPFDKTSAVPEWFSDYNAKKGTEYFIREQDFPKEKPYGWANYPFDYYNIWVKNSGVDAFREEPTLEMLSKDYNLIIFKHCFPVGYIEENTGVAELDSKEKSLKFTNFSMPH